MSTLSKQLVALFAVIIFSMAMYGCGGGGSSGPAMTTDDDDGGDDDTAMTCPEGQTGTYPDCMTPGPTAEEIAATTKAAGTKRKAIEAESGQAEDKGLGGDEGNTGDASAEPYMMEISRDRASTTIKITDSGLMGDDDPKFAQAEDLGGGTTMHSRMMEADDDGDVVEEVVIVTTDIEAPTATAFAKVTYPVVQALDVSTDTTNDNPTATSEALTVADTPEVRKLVMSSAFPTGRSATLNFVGDDAGTTDVDEADKVAGTYNGASGTYMCNDADCTVTIAEIEDDQLGITGITNWVFIPDEGATSDVPDRDYLHYGVWLKKTTDKDGVVTYDEVETFAHASSNLTRSTGINEGGTVTGKATYSGDATGVYVHSVATEDGSGEASATSGHFTADAELTATFNQVNDDSNEGTIAPNLLNTLSGTIDNFMLSGHDQGPGWSVTLEQDDIDGTGANPHVDGTAKGGGADGNYQATFHGGGGADSDQPSDVVGEFNAFFRNGTVAGGFGATKDSE